MSTSIVKLRYFFAVILLGCLSFTNAIQRTIETLETELDIKSALAMVESPVRSLNSKKAEVLPGDTIPLPGHFAGPMSSNETAELNTDIQGLQFPDPAAGVVLIEAPEGNAEGSAKLRYLLQLPTGRQGMAPDVALEYDSKAGNGWCGLGWNLATPTIEVDTRWGVPRYDKVKETETYLLNGLQLTPTAHRGVLEDRSADDKLFYPRVEGDFNRIIRHGKQPADYWWEVTDKRGVRSCYGGRLEEGMIENATLRDEAGNIARWALVETIDLNGNHIRYTYSHVADTGLPDGKVLGDQLYLKEIRYTGHKSEEGLYRIVFTRDRELGEARRADVQIEARLGLKQVTADLLRRIEVFFDKEPIRSYELQYEEGAFFKTLLSSISEYDAKGELFNTHRFAYHDDARQEGAYQPFAEGPKTWDTGQDELGVDFVHPSDEFNGDVSALGGTAGEQRGFSAAVMTGGNNTDLLCKTRASGGNFGYWETTSEGLVTLIDLNGDGRLDKVFMTEDGVYYRPNDPNPNDLTQLGQQRLLAGLEGLIYRQQSRTASDGFEGNTGIRTRTSVFVGRSRQRTQTITSVYFSDINADGLPDLVADGEVYYNHLDGLGVPAFSPSSADTPNPIEETGQIDPSIEVIDTDLYEALIDQNPLHDAVRMWVAPYTGEVKISGEVYLLEDTSPQRAKYETADGVRVTIEREGVELWADTLEANDYSPHNPTVPVITVQEGDRLFFRVQSREDGAYDQVHWNPTVKYQNFDELLGPDGKPMYEFTAGDDFLLTAAYEIMLPLTGAINIDGHFSKGVTSDDVKLGIYYDRLPNLVPDLGDYEWDETTPAPIRINGLRVEAGKKIVFKVSSNTNVDWTKVQWRPRIYYTETDDTDYPAASILTGSDTLLQFFPIVEYRDHGATLQSTTPWIAPASGGVGVDPMLSFSTRLEGERSIWFSVKREGVLPFKKELKIVDGQIVSPSNTRIYMGGVSAGDALFIAYYTTDRELAETIVHSQARVTGNITVEAGLYSVREARYDDQLSYIFGPLYRNWGQFFYNGNRERAGQPIDPDTLQMDPNLILRRKAPVAAADISELEMQADTAFNPESSSFIMAFPFAGERAWKGYDPYTFITATTMSSSRMGQKYIQPTSAIPAGSKVRAVHKVSEHTQTTYALGGGNTISGEAPEVFEVEGIYSETESVSQLQYDMIDLNGDGYPEVIGPEKIQYTSATGDLSDQVVEHDLGVVRSAQSQSRGVALTGGAYPVMEEGTSVGESLPDAKRGGLDVGGALSSTEYSGAYASGEHAVDFSWIDVNGDELPDRVYKNGEVALNLGYRFAPVEPWGYKAITEGHSEATGGSKGLGVSLCNGSYAAGFALSRSDNVTDNTLVDVNGDRLADIVDAENGLSVRLNTGSGFSEAIPWAGAGSLQTGSATGESENRGYTVCLPIPFSSGIFKVCYNQTKNVGKKAARELSTIRDFDGDGYADYLQSDSDEQLVVSRSTIGRTNKLKSVERPMGAVTSLDYEFIRGSYEMPEPIWALSSVEVLDGLTGDGADRTLTTFAYKDGYYDRREREFYGFATVSAREHDTENGDALYRTFVRRYLNDNFYEKGLPVVEFLEDAAGKKFTESTYTYELKDSKTGNPVDVSFEKNDAGTAFPALTTVEKRFYEGQGSAQKTMTCHFSYDRYGNVISYEELGENTPADDLSIKTAYHYYPDLHLVGAPEETVFRGNGGIYRQQRVEIEPATGNIRQVIQFTEASTTAVHQLDYDPYGNVIRVLRPANHRGQRLAYDYVYDPEVHTYVVAVTDSYGYHSEATYDYRFGQLLSTVDINGQKRQYDLDDLGRIVRFFGPYEADGGTATIVYEYHPDAAVPWASASHYDPLHPGNLMETAVFVDGLKREVQRKKDVAVSPGLGIPDQEQMVVVGGRIWDAFGRAVTNYEPVTEAKGNTGVFNETFTDIATTATFDVLDRLLTRTTSGGAITTLEYGFGTDRNGNTLFSLRTTDPKGDVEERLTDLHGHLLVLRTFPAGGAVSQTFVYNGVGERIAEIDNEGNAATYEYDWLGQLIRSDLPAAGKTTFRYDAAGNLIEKTTDNLCPDGNCTPIQYIYHFEQLTDSKYPQNPRNNTKYQYGETGEGDNLTGRIKFRGDATGYQLFKYGAQGELVENLRYIIVIPNRPGRTYTTRWTYDNWGRVTGMTYPDTEVLTYEYNEGGNLKKLKGVKLGVEYDYIRQLGYDKLGRRTFITYGNETETSYHYETGGDLSNMRLAAGPGRTIADYFYTYDPAGNLLSVENKAPLPRLDQMGGQTAYNFQYDGARRLTEASGLWQTKGQVQEFSLEVEYNSLSNLTHKEQVHRRQLTNRNYWEYSNFTSYRFDYEYSASNPYAPARIGNWLYSYDANGNLLNREEDYFFGLKRSLLWDEENRMLDVDDDEISHSYVYDANDQRGVKRNEVGQFIYINGEPVAVSDDLGDYTIYVNPYMTVTAAGYTKHIYIGGERISSKVGLGGPFGTGTQWGDWEGWYYWEPWDNWANNENWDQIPDPYTDQNWRDYDDDWNDWQNNREFGHYFYHPDHLGNSNYITDYLGEVHQHLEYFPFGELFVQEHKYRDRTPYLFEGEEWDRETGLYYARRGYYDPQVGRWLDVGSRSKEDGSKSTSLMKLPGINLLRPPQRCGQ